MQRFGKILLFKANKRKTDLNEISQSISKNLTYNRLHACYENGMASGHHRAFVL